MPAPSYNPPPGNNVLLDFRNTGGAYAAPAGNAVVFNFSNAAAVRRKQILSS